MLSMVVNIVTGVHAEMSLSRFTAVALMYFVVYMLVYWLGKRALIGEKRDLRAYVRKKLFTGLLWVSEKEYHSRLPGDIAARFQQQVDVWEESFLDPLHSLIKDAVVLLVSFFAVVSWKWEIALGTIILFSCYLLLSKGISRRCEALLNKSVQATMSENNELITMVKGFWLARDCGQEAFFIGRYAHQANIAALASYRCNMLYNILAFVNQNLGTVLTLVVIFIGGILLESGTDGITVGEVLGLTQLIVTIISPISSLGATITKLRGTKTLREDFRSYERNGAREKEACFACGEPVPELERLSLRNVSFSYGEELVLKDVSLTFLAGKKYAIVGESGSGKTTLLKLILKQIEPASGSIYWNGIPYAQIGKRELLRNISYVAQEPVIFRKSIEDNVIAGSSYSEEANARLQCALEQSCVLSMRKNQAAGALLAVPAQELSGGEKKRVAYARALYKNGKILVLDELTSSVHEEMAQEIEKKLLQDKRLVIHITHRLCEETAQQYDGIYEVTDGRILCVKHS